MERPLNHNSISEIRTLLAEEGIALKKRFGQNFLVDEHVRRKIGELIANASPAISTGHGEVWEIGPGLGSLTEELLARKLRLRLFEIDHGIIRILRKRYDETIPIEEGDFLHTFRRVPPPEAIVGNLPYHSAGAIVPRIVEAGIPVPVMAFLLQEEMVDRLVSSTGNKNYSALTVLVRSHYHVERVFSVPASAFYPRPRVNSAVALLRERTDRPGVELTALISRLARTAFGQRRKTLRNTLREYQPLLEQCEIDPALRPEQLAPPAFVTLARAVLRSLNRSRTA